MIIKCSYCEQEFDKEVRRVNEAKKKGAKLFCSKECLAKDRTKKILCKCAHCGEDVIRSNAELNKSKSGNAFCNRSCAASYNNSHFRTGENNPNWKGGVNKSREHSRLAFQNYKPICVVCNHESKPALQVHHIDYNHANNELDNLIILCANCHCEVHYGKELEITEKIKEKRVNVYGQVK